MSTKNPCEVLVIWPPEVPHYFNAGHHLPIFMVAQYLRICLPQAHVMAIDAGVLNYTWKDLGNLLGSAQFDVIAVMNDFGSIAAIRPFIRYARALQPTCKLLTFGRLSFQIPGFFQRYDLDGIVESGDYESGVAAAVSYFKGLRADAAGVRIRRSGAWEPADPGIYLPAEEWPFADVSEIPYDAYDRQYADDSRKFCGIPERRELVVVVARGCPVGCSYCEVPFHQGLRERRRPVQAVIDHIEAAFKQQPFEYVSFYAPTFTLNRPWVIELCARLQTLGTIYPWKCVTTIHHLDEELVNKMAESGCVRISVGLETLEQEAQNALPKLKRKSQANLELVATWCRRANIELNCFVILGLPGESAEGAQATMATARKLGARVRPTLYTPYQDLASDMDEDTVASFDRQLPPLTCAPPDNAADVYSLLFGGELKRTKVMDSIRRRT